MKTIDTTNRKWYTIYVVKKYNNKQKGVFKMKTMQEFTKVVTSKVASKLGKGYEVTHSKVRKQGDKLLDAVMIREEGANVSPNIYLNALYEEYQKGASVDKIVEDMVNIYFQSQKNAPMNVMENMEKLENILPFLINAKKNKEYIAEHDVFCMDVPFSNDVKVAFRKVVGSESNMLQSFVISKEFCKSVLGVKPEVLHEKFANANEPMITDMNSMLDNIIFGKKGEITKSIEVSDLDFDAQPMYVLSCKNGVNGASVILNNDFMKKVEKQLGSFYILPSSVHEVILVSNNDKFSAKELKEMVKEVNATRVQPDEFLADELYLFENGVIKSVA